MNRYFILGTDTDCGKTYVTCQLLDYLNQQTSAMALKPVISGVDADDSYALLKRHNRTLNEDISLYSFKSPIAPHLAAAEEGVEISLSSLVDFVFSPTYSNVEHLLIEGAGGLMVPLGDQTTWIDFLIASKIPVILVVGMRLGCINHALLTEFVLRANRIECLGFIANCLDKNMLVLDENIRTLEKTMKIPLLTTIPYATKVSIDSMPCFTSCSSG